jgi:hypothetical protein
MSCGHEGCTCGPETPTDREPLPVADDTTAGRDGCCGGHGGAHHHTADEPDAVREHKPQAR